MRRVVVTGLGIISPIGNDVQTFWENLSNGVCGIDYITRFDTEDYKVKIAAEVKDFNPDEFMERSEVRRTDRYTQFAIAAAKQAVDSSGIEGSIDPDRLGVYVGSGIGGMETLTNEHSKLFSGGPKRVSPYFVPMIISNIAAGTIAIRYNAQGPCLPVVTACATSSNAIGEAFRAIKHGYVDAIIAGGAEAAINPISVAGFTNIMALSTKNDPNDTSIPFDKRRDGFVIGEGAAILILEEYEHAKNRNATIYGEITGYGHTCDAHHITAPNQEGTSVASAIKAALNESNATGDEKIYINAHGTSTPLNDKTETIAIKKALGENAHKALVSSTKSMTGHMLGAAGATEAIASILAIKNGVIPPTIGYKEPDPECDLNIVANHNIKEDVDFALSTSLGFGGHNACLVFKKI
ncbi:MAG: fabF [Bacillales bacterium]|jgi:3-oxoacyl-[acyl-carrier-protein] synthase II|nr:fabF [Bacillales bacterium]